jgi:hypothetical protein
VTLKDLEFIGVDIVLVSSDDVLCEILEVTVALVLLNVNILQTAPIATPVLCVNIQRLYHEKRMDKLDLEIWQP